MSGGDRSFSIADESRDHAIGSGRFRLWLSRLDDRWAHGLELDGRAIVRAIEPVADEPDRFAAPIFQQASLRAGEADSLALLVGQAGPRHSSASMLVESLDDGSTLVTIDLAVRSTRNQGVEAASPASVYLVEATSSELIEAADSRFVWALRDDRGRLGFEAFDDEFGSTVVSLAEGGRRGTLVQAIARVDARSLTRRSRYRWSWKPSEIASEKRL